MKHTENERIGREDRITFLGVRREWAGFALQVSAQLVLVYGVFVTQDHLSGGWQGLNSIRLVVADLSLFVVAAAFVPFLIFAEVEILMILYNIVKEQIAERHKRREAQQERLIAEARAEGRAQERARARQEWHAWLERKEIAEAAGEPFNEPPPD